MRKKFLFLLLFIFIFLSKSNHIYASFLDVGVSPREMGMGEACIGLADNAYAGYYNPGGLAQLIDSQLGLSWTALYPGLDYLANSGLGFLSYALPLKFGAIASSWRQLYVSNLYQESSLLLSYGFPLLNKKLLLGSNVNVLYLNYGRSEWGYKEWEYPSFTNPSDPVFNSGTSAVGFGIDFGLLYKLNPNLSFGLLLKNINSPNISLGTTLLDSSKSQNIVPLLIGAGACYRLGEINNFEDLKIMCDFQYSNADYQVNLGFESWLLGHKLGVRAGSQIGARTLLNFSCGASYIFPLFGENFSVDYAFRLPLNELQSRFGTHRIGLIASFGERKRKLEQKERQERERKRKEELEEAMKKAAEEEMRKKAEEEEKKKIEEEEKKRKEEEKRLEEERLRKEIEEKLKFEEELKKLEAEKAAVSAELQKAKEEAEKARLEAEKMKEMPKEVSMKETARGLAVNIGASVSFLPGKATLTPTAYSILDKIIDVINAYPDNKISIEGHTDSTGSRKLNLTLSLQRAENVASYFITKGVARERISVYGFGPDRPIASNATSSGREKNRRVEIIILK